ncbi:MAG: hypothetical protein EOM87_04380 [Clostridia bacterium]|nr:hypothetical protein [Clostridia bacterium]
MLHENEKKSTSDSFFVMVNFNRNRIETFDVIAVLKNIYVNLRVKDRPTDRKSLIEFIEHAGKYHFLAKCEYEVIVGPWPYYDWLNRVKDITARNLEDYEATLSEIVEIEKKQLVEFVKIDVWDQIEINIEVIADILFRVLKLNELNEKAEPTAAKSCIKEKEAAQ